MCISFWNTKICLFFPTKFVIINFDYFPTRHFLNGFYNEQRLCGTFEDIYVYI